MIRNSKLSVAIAAVLAAGSTAPTVAAELEEIIVTATKRAESAQDIPIAVQVLGEQALGDLGIGNFKDYIRNLPGVTSGGRGPGRNNIYIRGVSTGKGAVKLAAAAGTEPNVALYLDETPISIGGRNMDPYMTDMSRVEVLPGPQGTLFGASSQAGTVRLITNKPLFDGFDAGFDTSVSDTSGGAMGYAVEAYFNIPIAEDKLAARVAMFNVKQGGYIDNVRGSKQISLGNPSLGTPPSERDIADNNKIAGDDFNDSTYAGVRVSVNYAVNDDWDILVQQFHQEIETEGVWDFDPLLGDLQVQTFSPDTSEDVFDLTSWTVSGRMRNLELVYTGSYLDRTVESISDYAGYADVGPFIPYYICSYPGYDSCGAPDLFLDQFFGVERTTQEFRISTEADKRWRGIIGVYADDTETIERGDFNYPASVAQGFAPNAPIPGATATNPNTRPAGVTFFNDFTRGKKELSFFGELTFDITDSWSATVGARRYDIELSLLGSSNFGNRGVDRDSGRNIDAVLALASPADFQDTIYKFNLQWNLIDDVMLYTTWSEGYRPGGFNRNGGASQLPGIPPFVPTFYESDELTNIELGWKTTLFDGSLRFNGAVYALDWNRIQVQTLDFSISNLTFVDNTADAEIRGVELDSIWIPTDHLTLFANISFNDTELTRVPPNIVNISPVGSPLALAPELQYVVRGRYDWSVGNDGEAFAQISFLHTDEAVSSIVLAAQFQQDSYNTIEASFGYAADNWSATFYVENLTDERAELFVNNQDSIVKITPNRPRTVGLRFSYRIDGL